LNSNNKKGRGFWKYRAGRRLWQPANGAVVVGGRNEAACGWFVPTKTEEAAGTQAEENDGEGSMVAGAAGDGCGGEWGVSI